MGPLYREHHYGVDTGIALIRPLGTNLNEILIEIYKFNSSRLRNGGHFVSALMC